LVGKPEERRPLGRTSGIVGGLKTVLEETVSVGVEWINLVQDGDQLQALNTV
jgi:hypothetical protein